jgi:predicted transcriptional regulator
MSQVKERMTEIIRAQPDDSTFEEILRELAFAHMVDRGMQDSRDGKLISNEEVRRRLDSWRK